MGSAALNLVTGDFTLESMTPCDLSSCTKEGIRRYFENTYNLYESLFVGLKDQSAFYKYPDCLRLPLIFYYGHTAAVYINKLVLGELLQPSERVNLHLEMLFETGVDEMSWDDTENWRMGGEITWPSLTEVVEYRQRVRELVLSVIDRTPLELPVTYDSTWWPVFMGIEHERLHLETSSVLMRQLPVNMVERPRGWNYGPKSAGDPVLVNRMIRVGQTTVTLGKPQDFPSYGWDNEYGQLDCRVPEFEASEYLITNREFLSFIQDGGYTKKSLWTEEGWCWREYRKTRHPPFWTCGGDCQSACGADLAKYSHCKAASEDMNGTPSQTNGDEEDAQDLGVALDDSYRLRVMFDVIPMPWDWPVVINYHEGKAFCAWKGPDYRLPCEPEDHVIRGNQRPPCEELSHKISSQSETHVNINLAYGSSTPVNLHPPNDQGFYDVYGNVWEWMEDDFNGLPGTKTSTFYEDFSAPYFDGLHNTLLSGSWVTTGDATSQFARGWFRRHFLQHAGFRVVRSVTSGSPAKVPICHIQDADMQKNHWTLPESVECEAVPTASSQLRQDNEESLAKQLHEDWQLEQPPAITIVDMAVTTANKYLTGSSGRCLYQGCGTGRGAAPLRVPFDEVLAVDFNGRFIDTCLKLQAGGVVNLPGGTALTVPTNELSKVTFKQLNWLPNEVRSFDLVLSTILDRVNNCKAWLIRMKEVVKSNGLLIIASRNYGAHALQQFEVLKSSFELLETKDLPLTSDVTDIIKVTVWRHH